MIKSKGLIVYWPDPEEGQTASMQFGHEDGRQREVMRQSFIKSPKATHGRVVQITNKKRHTWIIRVCTHMDYTNKRTGSVTTEIINSVIKPKTKCTLFELAKEIEKVQLEDMSDCTKKISKRTIECFCKD